jgi:hypothetical protein
MQLKREKYLFAHFSMLAAPFKQTVVGGGGASGRGGRGREARLKNKTYLKFRNSAPLREREREREKERWCKDLSLKGKSKYNSHHR